MAVAGVALGFAVGLVVYVEHPAYVPDSRALVGAAIAAVFLTAVPLGAYYMLTLRARRLLPILAWLAVSIIPLCFYGFVGTVVVLQHAQCPVNDQACPTG